MVSRSSQPKLSSRKLPHKTTCELSQSGIASTSITDIGSRLPVFKPHCIFYSLLLAQQLAYGFINATTAIRAFEFWRQKKMILFSRDECRNGYHNRLS